MYVILFHRPLWFFGINTTHAKCPSVVLEDMYFQHSLPLLIEPRCVFTGVFARSSLAAPDPGQVVFPPVQTLFCRSTWVQNQSLLSGGGSDHINYLNFCKEDICLLPVYSNVSLHRLGRLHIEFALLVIVPFCIIYFVPQIGPALVHHLFQMPREGALHTAPSSLASPTGAGAARARVNSLSLSTPELHPFADVPEFVYPTIYVPVFGDCESSCCKHNARCLSEDRSWVLWDKCPSVQFWAVPFGG